MHTIHILHHGVNRNHFTTKSPLQIKKVSLQISWCQRACDKFLSSHHLTTLPLIPDWVSEIIRRCQISASGLRPPEASQIYSMAAAAVAIWNKNDVTVTSYLCQNLNNSIDVESMKSQLILSSQVFCSRFRSSPSNRVWNDEIWMISNSEHVIWNALCCETC